MRRKKSFLHALVFAFAISAALRPLAAAPPENTDAACARCHQQIYTDYERTPMARASGAAVNGLIPGDFIHADSGIRYRLFLKDGKAWLSYHRSSDVPAHSLDGEQELLYYLGSGRRGRTYLFQRDGYWFEIPVNWYAKKHIWDMTPNYLHAKEMPLTLPVDPGCLHCHASDVQPSLPGSRNHFAGAPFLHNGIGCASCHGDVSVHLAQNGKGPILNPARLDAARRDSVCLQCHVEGESAIARRGHSLTSYHPGDNLFDHVAFFVHKGEEGPSGRATSQWEALLESKCKQQSGDRLTCTTCHDPHRSPGPEERVAYYRSKCIICHNDTAFVANHHPENPDCASCHMPRQSTEDIAHEQATDHRIQRVSANTLESSAQKSSELTAIGNSAATPREYGLAYAQMALHGDKFALEQALGLLQAAESSAGNSMPDPQLHTQVGFLEQIKGEKAKAEQEYQMALKDDSLNSIAAGNLAILRAQEGDTAGAIHLLESVFLHDPVQVTADYDLAAMQCALGNTADAEQTLRRLLLFSPDNSQAREFALAITSGEKRCGSAH
ncbi:MAG TPA: tetratricopeptide repeat protein [Pseudacidobacterium sp.]|jgi:predicted CXXCH cytochrome family protein|nr:tetratricopeptide repeat protein [Pseudacidobacterium sp.]